jgi:hypothetical protein
MKLLLFFLLLLGSLALQLKVRDKSIQAAAAAVVQSL